MNDKMATIAEWEAMLEDFESEADRTFWKLLRDKSKIEIKKLIKRTKDSEGEDSLSLELLERMLGRIEAETMREYRERKIKAIRQYIEKLKTELEEKSDAQD